MPNVNGETAVVKIIIITAGKTNWKYSNMLFIILSMKLSLIFMYLVEKLCVLAI